MTKFLRPLFFALLILTMSGCPDTDREPLLGPNGEPVVYGSIAPLAGLVRSIAGEQVEVRSLVAENQDPHDFSPTPKQLVDLSSAAAFFTTSMPFEEGLVEKLRGNARKLRIVDVSKGIELREFEQDHSGENKEDKGGTEAHDHEHEHDHDHHHEHGDDEMDPHIWLSPPLLEQQVPVIVKALSEIDPENEAVFRRRGEELTEEIRKLHAELSQKLAPFRGRKFYVYHGAFAYFAEAYGLKQEAIEIGGRRPEQKRIMALIRSAKEDGVKMIFVQPQFDSASARTIADAIEGNVIAIDPLSPDLFGVLRKIADAIGSMHSEG